MSETSAVTQVTAIVAIILSSITLAWNIYKDGFRDRARIKLSVGFRLLTGNGVTENDVLVWSYTNTGGKPIRITHVIAEGTGTKSYLIIDDKLPVKIEPGDYQVSLCKEFGGLTDIQQLSVADSLGRKWHAPKSEVAEVNKQIKELASKGITSSWMN
ncbi:MAG TPA: hypothetical protein VGO34_03320 [Alphaproteobacteria bacterium]|jgi:hypothetical protein